MRKLVVCFAGSLTFGVALVGVQSYVYQGPVDTVYQSLRQKKKLFQSVGSSYSNEMVIDSFVKLQNPYDTDYYKVDMLHIDDLSNKYKQDVLACRLAPMYLKFISSDVGHGIFASRPIEKGDFIGVYTGELRPVRYGQPGKPEDVDYAWYYAVNSSDGKRLIIDGKYQGNELRFINHDNNPNTRRIDVIVDGVFYICYVAQRYIPQDAQLTVHYGDSYWKSRKVTPASVS